MATAKKPPAKGVAKKVETDSGQLAPPQVEPEPVVQEAPVLATPEFVSPETHFAPLTSEQIASIEPTNPVSPTKVHFDETDVGFALARETQDGRGDKNPGPSDFNGFPAEGVIKEE